MAGATIYTIAERLGVSASTVSRAFSRPEKVSPELRRRVVEVAEEIGYQPSPSARRLATGRSNMLGVMMPDVTNPFFPPLLRAIRLAAHAHDVEVMFIDSDETPASEEHLIARVKRQIDGLIMASPRSEDAVLVAATADIPTVCINRVVPGLASTYCDDDDALFASMGHLKKLGHADVAILEGPENSWVARRRSAAIGGAAARFGMNLTSIGHFTATFDGGVQAAPSLARSEATCAFAFDDVTAFGVIAGLHSMGLSVPQDISLIGCDDVAFAAMVTPPLTTISAPVTDLGTTAVDLVMDRIGEPAGDPSVVPVRSTFAVRGTTAAPAKAAAASTARGQR